MRLTVVVGLSTLALSFESFAGVFIVEDGEAKAQIIIPENPPRMVKLAGEEFQRYIRKITGATLPITTRPAPEYPIKIFVGKSKYTDELGITDEGLRHGGFKMVSKGDWLVLLGHDSDFKPRRPFLRGHGDWKRLLEEWDKLTGEKWGFPHPGLYKCYSRKYHLWEQDERGSLNAVYEFLRMQGVRWYLPDPLGEIVPKKKSIRLPKVKSTVRPDFPLRYAYQYYRRFGHPWTTRDELLWQLRLGFNEAPDLIGLGPMGHGINPVHSREEVKKAHPEYYALFGGKRAMQRAGKPCLSSEGLMKANARYVRAVFDIFDEPSISVMPADGYVNLCQCELCKDKGTPERGWNGQLSDYVWGYVNRVARELYKTHPQKTISCLAYGAYLLPPLKIKKLSPNIRVGIAQARVGFYDPDTRNFYLKMRNQWRKKMSGRDRRLWIWEYYLYARPNGRWAYMPVYYPHIIAEDLRDLKGKSIGDFIEVYRSLEGISTLAVTHLNLYVTARFWWNAEQDIDKLLDEYYTNFYGPARDEMKAFIEFSEANWMKLTKEPPLIDRLFEFLSKAEEKVSRDSVYAKRIGLIASYIKPLKDLREQLAKGRQNVPIVRLFERDPKQIIIDGKLDDKFWEDLPSYSLRELQTGKKPAFGTTFKVAWGGDSIYFGIICLDRDTRNLNIGATKRGDPNVWVGDNVEILIETQVHSYYQLAIAPSGALVDADRKKGIKILWSSEAEVASHIGEKSWTVEIRIPVAGDQQEQLDPLHGLAGRTPTETYPWFFNVCRQRIRDNDRQLSAFSPTGKASFHDLMKFAKLYIK